MKQDDYWERFLESGSVKDYLEFRAECLQNGASCRNQKDADRKRTPDDMVREHAGFSDGYGNDTEEHPGW